MMIQRIEPSSAVANQRALPTPAQGGDFAALLRSPSQNPAAPAPLAKASVASLLALQELQPTTGGRTEGSPDTKRRTIGRLMSGRRALQLGMLEGRDIGPTLDELSNALAALPASSQEPGSDDLAALRLRVRLELARHGSGGPS